ncbi:plastocyanin/azurin family copper-binding protein [Streptomyces sp. NBC_00461]|uniref:cupredoxin domain-containing protein n=1 Tax=unclassified Streptomyces TaxID=2593676 RepID=UPI002259F7E6|nr:MULTISPECIES: plastocyanin/azurin family copper-binding protein [unclassified Streptomyces]MCX5061983.1 plastocyanin/azurin family copper-binding protein [Streptomyces sp. NBC_00452]
MPRLTVPRILLAAVFVAGPVTVLPAPAAQAATTHQVVMSGYAFAPRSLTITAGDTVTWSNQDQAPHDVKTTSGPAPIHSPMLNKGGSWSHTFTAAGTYGYLCTVHPGMTAQLVVEPAAAPTTHAPVHHHPAPDPAAPPTRRSASAMPPMTMDPSKPATREAAAPAASEGTSSPAPSAAAQPAPDTRSANVSAARPLDPLLLLTGVVAGVAVLCLLLVGSRSAAPRSEDPGTN